MEPWAYPHHDHWVCCVLEAGGEKPRPYRLGGPRAWWLRPGQRSFQAPCFCALLLAGIGDG
eukprot:14949887-Alexandrium_andersonii.AAC.1